MSNAIATFDASDIIAWLMSGMLDVGLAVTMTTIIIPLSTAIIFLDVIVGIIYWLCDLIR